MSHRTGPCCSVSYRRMGEWMSCRTGPCCCVVSYKRMEEKDVMWDRSSLLGFLQKNGGKGCHNGQALIER